MTSPFHILFLCRNVSRQIWLHRISVLLRDISVWTDLTGAKDPVHLPLSVWMCCQSVSRVVILSVSLWACNSSIKIVLLETQEAVEHALCRQATFALYGTPAWMWSSASLTCHCSPRWMSVLQGGEERENGNKSESEVKSGYCCSCCKNKTVTLQIQQW